MVLAGGGWDGDGGGCPSRLFRHVWERLNRAGSRQGPLMALGTKANSVTLILAGYFPVTIDALVGEHTVHELYEFVNLTPSLANLSILGL